MVSLGAWARRKGGGPARRRVGIALAVVVLSAAIMAGALRGGLAMGRPDIAFRSFGDLPSALREPSFESGPFPAGHALSQTLAITAPVAGLELWLKPQPSDADAVALVEIRGGRDGPSLRSGRVQVHANMPRALIAIRPPLEPRELAPGALAYLRLSAADDSTPIFVGVIRGERYAPGQSFVANEASAPDQDVAFAALRPVSLAGEAERARAALGATPSGVGIALAAIALAAPGALALAVGGPPGGPSRGRLLAGAGLVVVAAAFLVALLTAVITLAIDEAVFLGGPAATLAGALT